MESKRYLGKAPIHQLYLDILVDLFPDATFIYTYRTVTESLTSFLSLIKYLLDPFGYKTSADSFLDRLSIMCILEEEHSFPTGP